MHDPTSWLGAGATAAPKDIIEECIYLVVLIANGECSVDRGFWAGIELPKYLPFSNVQLKVTQNEKINT